MDEDPTRPAQTPARRASEGADEAIPMLTEVLQNAQSRAEPLPPAIHEDWNRIALQVQERVLKRLLARSEQLIDDPVREGLHASIGRAVERLGDELHDLVRAAVRDAVGRAITEEIARAKRELQSLPNAVQSDASLETATRAHGAADE